MKTTMISRFLYCVALIAVVVSIIQWYVKFPDLSQLVFGLNIALSIVICAFMHSAFRNMGDEQREKEGGLIEQIKDLDKALDVSINYARELEVRLDKHLQLK